MSLVPRRRPARRLRALASAIPESPSTASGLPKEHHEYIGQSPHFVAGLCRQGPRPRRLGPQGDRHRRNRNARPDGDARRIRGGTAAARRSRRRLIAHDHSNRRADRDAQGARRRRALGVLQHLLDAGSRRGRGGGRRHAGLRGQRRDAPRLLGIHPSHLRVVRRRRAQHDPRRRRRRHLAAASRRASRSRLGRAQPPEQRRGRGAVRGHQAAR